MENEAPREQVITDIVIPERLLWAPTKSKRNRDYRINGVDDAPAKNGPVQQAVDAHLNQVQHGEYNRTIGIAMSRPEVAPNDGEDGVRFRKNSQIVNDDDEARDDGVRFRKNSQIATANFEETEWAAEEPHPPITNLFRDLNAYSINSQGSGAPQDFTERDPHARNSWFPRNSWLPRSNASARDSGFVLPRGASYNPRWSAVAPIEPPPTARCRRVGSEAPPVMQRVGRRLSQAVLRSTPYEVYDKAKTRGAELHRKRWAQLLFDTFYVFLLVFTYFVFVGIPLWKGAVWWLYGAVQHKFAVTVAFIVIFSIAALYACVPLLMQFERDPTPNYNPHYDATKDHTVQNTALLIPCCRSASIIGATLEAALKIFPASHIFVVANGNSPTPLDNTEDICLQYGVTHLWSPIGSKIVAQFVGCYAAKDFQHVLLIDDDCTLPADFPVVGDRLVGKVKSIGYTIKSAGPDGSKGNYCQQAQDFEYKISGLHRAFAGFIGSATFPHGAISLWDREFLIRVFHDHPGFSVSEDWFFGHSCRRLGGRIDMCSAVFVATETPPAVFYNPGGGRGGVGEMTVFQQRFSRWNMFLISRIWYNMTYIVASWNLGWSELGAKLFVFQEVYETLLYLLTPFILPISIIVQPALCGYLVAGTVGLYVVNSIIFNELHLRFKNERVSYMVLIFYYMPYKIMLTAIDVLSCYCAIFKHARCFANRQPKVIEDENTVEIVLRLEDATDQSNLQTPGLPFQGRKMSVTTVITRMSVSGNDMNIPVPLLTGSQARAKRSSRSGRGISVQFADLPKSPNVPQNRFSRLFGPKPVLKVEDV
ncbi:glycosyl transferase [Ilyonectria destructans]|nr:glycosyl transferase [Ilyonectria destructans]